MSTKKSLIVKEKSHLTRWQLRVGPDLEKLIRAKSTEEHRSINQTLIVIIESYFGGKRPGN